MTKGIVVEDKSNGIRYAISEKNFNPKTQDKVRELKRFETVRGFKPRPRPEKTTPSPSTSVAKAK